MEVTDINKTEDKETKDASMDISSKCFGVNVGISGHVTNTCENTLNTKQTAKYQVHVTASQQLQTEGLLKLKNVKTNHIEPIDVSSGK